MLEVDVVVSLGDVYVDTKVGLLLDVGLQVGHLEVIIDPVDYEVGEPWGLSWCLEKLLKKLQTLLAEVISENFETHQSRIMEETLSKESQAVIFHIIVSQVQVHKRLIL